MKTEAAVTIATVEAVVLAMIPLASRMFGWDLDLQDDVTLLAIAVVALVVPLLGGLAIRRQVWSEQSHERAVDVALRTPPPADD